MTKFKIEGTCIDTSTMKGYVPAAILGSGFDYILTSIPANNDVLIKDYVSSFKLTNTKLIVHANHLDSLCDTVKSHIELIGRDFVDILLVDSKADWKLAGSEVVGLGDRCKAWGIMEPESVEEVKKIIDECYTEAKRIITENIDVLHASAKLLMEKERITREEFEALFG